MADIWNIWNSPFEISLRALLLLAHGDGNPKTVDMLVLLDTIAIYGNDFGISDENLHGDIDFALDEFDSRRELMKTAIRDLVLRGLVTPIKDTGGFRYKISLDGSVYCRRLSSDYAVEYRQMAIAVKRLVESQSEREIFAMINSEINIGSQEE